MTGVARGFYSRAEIASIAEQVLGRRLPGRSAQGILEESVVQNYDLGSPLVLPPPDNRKYRYFKAGEALAKYLGAYNHNQWPVNGNTVSESASGQKQLRVPDAVGAANDYAGGYIVIFTSPLQAYLIVSNTASDGTEVTLTLKDNLQSTIPVGTWVTGYPSMYRNVQAPPAPDPDYISFVCVPNINVQLNHFFWGQVKGWCYGVADGTVPGSAANHRDVYFATSGNLSPYGDGPAGIGGQYAGYLLPRTENGSGDQLYFLQLE